MKKTTTTVEQEEHRQRLVQLKDHGNGIDSIGGGGGGEGDEE